MLITYTDNIDSVKESQLQGFFVRWPSPPPLESHLKILGGSYAVWLAFHQEQCVGFINALSDGVFYAYIPLLEVLPDYQKQGIGTELLRRMVNTLETMYAIDLVCDESIAPFYTKKDFTRCVGMIKRNYANQGAKLRI